MPQSDDMPSGPYDADMGIELRVRRMHRRDINRVWQFLKMVFRGVNRETVEFQRPPRRSKRLGQGWLASERIGGNPSFHTRSSGAASPRFTRHRRYRKSKLLAQFLS